MQPTYRIRYFFDYGGICLWAGDTVTSDTFNYPIDPERLPLSAETTARIHHMITWHETSLNWDYPPDPGPWRQDECHHFNLATRALYTLIQDELGNEFEVVYEQRDFAEDPDLDAYLKNPKAFKRP